MRRFKVVAKVYFRHGPSQEKTVVVSAEGEEHAGSVADYEIAAAHEGSIFGPVTSIKVLSVEDLPEDQQMRAAGYRELPLYEVV